jgi:DNA-binding beta-propeller fold protein YncE
MRRIAAVALLVLALSGCSNARHSPGAAEPATAPARLGPAAGRSVAVGEDPEGVVYDRTTATLAVAVRNPDRLLLLSPDTLLVRRSVALPGSVRHLQLAGPGGPVLVPVESVNELLEVSLTGGPTRVTPVLKQPHDASAAAAGDVVVGDEFGHSLSIVRDGRVRATISGLKQPGGVIGDRSRALVVDVGAFTISSYDLTTLKRTAVAAAGDGPTHDQLIDADRVAVVDTRGDALLLFTISPLRVVGRLALPGTPYGMAMDATTGTLWVTLTARNQVLGIDVRTDRPQVIATYPTVRQPNTVAVSRGSDVLWITGTAAGMVQRISR